VVGGYGIHVDQLSKVQAAKGHDVTVCTSWVDNNPKEEQRDGYRIRRFKSLVNLFGNSITHTMFFSLIRNRNKYDIVHAHSHLFFTTNLCAFVNKLDSPPLVITNHGLVSQTAPMLINKIYMPTIAKWTLESADKIICYAIQEKEGLEKLGINSNKISIIHNGINTNLFVPNSNERKHNMQILWVGRFVPGKGVEYLIDAFSLLIKDYPNLRLVMLGWGPERDMIVKKIHQHHLQKNIIMKRFVPNQELPNIYQASDIFVLPSIEEGVPRTLLEAMACKVPVVYTNLPQVVDTVKDAGLAVPKEDPQALADGISKIISDKSFAQRLGENGRRNVVENYSWDDTVEKTIELYEELI
jgi:glycosyltransferase involved in cell wall biosynthesis